MAAVLARLLALLAALAAPARAGAADPVRKALELLSDLEAKIAREGQEAEKTYEGFSRWCSERSQALQRDIKAAKSEAEELKAAIEQAASSASALNAQVEETSAGIAGDEADLKAATKIRESERVDFEASEKELVEVTGALERAIGILEREARKGSAAMLQLQKATGVVQALKAMVEASMLGSQDAATLTALVQGAQQDADEGDGPGAPEAAAYENHGAAIVETLEGLLDKAKDQLQQSRTREATAAHNFQMLKQSLEDETSFAGKRLAEAKKSLSAEVEAKAGAQGDLTATSRSLAEDEKTLAGLKQDCAMRAQDHEAEVKSRGEELKALAEGKKAIAETTAGAAELTYGSGKPSFLQLRQGGGAGQWTGADLANFEAVRFVRNLARKEHSEALAQLARRMASVMRYSSAAGDDPFAKVKMMVKGMIETLLRESQADATHKAYCDKEMGETLQKKEDREAELEKLDTKVESMSSGSAQLKAEVAALQKSLAELSQAQAELSALRLQEKEQYKANKPEMESGLQGVKLALKILREYYAKEAADHNSGATDGSTGGIIGLLEVVESDFAKRLAEMAAAEAAAKAAYEEEARENEIEKATKEQDVKYKEREYRQLDQAIAEANSDREGTHAELTAILEYDKHLLQICVAKPETFEERAARREAEIAGLKQALSILEGEAVLLQRQQRRRGLRLGAKA